MVKRKVTWSRILGFFCMGVFLAIYAFASVSTNWSPPTKGTLIFVNGKFVTLQKGTFQPYEFKTEDGEDIQLGCVPGIRVVDCLSHVAESPELKGFVTIGYIKVHIPWWKFTRVRWSNVLVTVDEGRTPVLDYSVSSARIKRAYAFDQESKWMVPFILLPFAVASLFVAIGAGIKKAKHEI